MSYIRQQLFLLLRQLFKKENESSLEGILSDSTVKISFPKTQFRKPEGICKTRGENNYVL